MELDCTIAVTRQPTSSAPSAERPSARSRKPSAFASSAERSTRTICISEPKMSAPLARMITIPCPWGSSKIQPARARTGATPTFSAAESGLSNEPPLTTSRRSARIAADRARKPVAISTGSRTSTLT